MEVAKKELYGEKAWFTRRYKFSILSKCSALEPGKIINLAWRYAATGNFHRTVSPIPLFQRANHHGPIAPFILFTGASSRPVPSQMCRHSCLLLSVMRQKLPRIFYLPSLSGCIPLQTVQKRGIYYTRRIDREMLTVIHFGRLGATVLNQWIELNKKYLCPGWKIYSSFHFARENAIEIRSIRITTGHFPKKNVPCENLLFYSNILLKLVHCDSWHIRITLIWKSCQCFKKDLLEIYTETRYQ